MRIEVLRIADCPSTDAAVANLHEALTLTGADALVAVRVIRSEADAEGTGFAGSPTILVDGSDLFPSTGGTDQLACRVYATPAGLRGLPEVGQLVAALGARRLQND